MSLENLDDAPRELKIAGRVYRCSPLRPYSHLAILRRKILEDRPRPIEMIKGSLDGLSEEHKIRLLERAYEDQSRALRVTDDDAYAYIGTNDGFCFLLWVCINDAMPDVTLEQIMADVKPLSARELCELIDRAGEVMGLEKKRPTSEAPANGQPGSTPTTTGSFDSSPSITIGRPPRSKGSRSRNSAPSRRRKINSASRYAD